MTPHAPCRDSARPTTARMIVLPPTEAETRHALSLIDTGTMRALTVPTVPAPAPRRHRRPTSAPAWKRCVACLPMTLFGAFNVALVGGLAYLATYLV